MAHPVYDATTYPWHITAAEHLHDLLVQIVTDPSQIRHLYRQSAGGLSPLNLSASPAAIWREALDNMATNGALRNFVAIVEDEYPGNVHLAAAIQAIDDMPDTPVIVLPGDDEPEGNPPREQRIINTGGGSYIEGTSNVEGGDFVGRDRTDRLAPEAGFQSE